MFKSLVFGLAFLLLSLSAGQILAAPPVEAFGKLPDFSSVKISPTGSHLASVRWVDGVPNLTIYTLNPAPGEERMKALSLDFSDSVEEKVKDIFWLGDERIGVAISFEAERWNVDTLETRLMSVAVDLSDVRQIPKQPKNRSQFRTQIQDRILDFMPDDPDHVMMAFDRNGLGQELNVYKVNIHDGSLDGIAFGNEDVASYMVDRQGQVRLKFVLKEKKKQIFIRDNNEASWRKFVDIGREDAYEFFPAGFSNDSNILFVYKESDAGLVGLFTFDLRKNAIGEEFFAVKGIDVGKLRVDTFTRRVIGVSYAKDFDTHLYIDGAFASLQNSVDSAFPHTQNSITSWDRNRTKFVILSTSARHPGTYYLFDTTTRQLSRLLDRYAYPFAEEDLNEVIPITFEARDGLEIPGYLTQPKGPGPHPFVVLPHGGPTGRDYMVYDYWVQFIASRGYAVLQPNFRGSSGYGVKFLQAGYGEWGLAMQDDIEDGVRSMIARGVADPDRVCIFGWSYGGYAALMGVIKTPDLYQCAISGAPVTDIRRALSEDAKYKFVTLDRPSVGKYWGDRGKLRDTSPINNADLITAPVLLLHGENDLSVKVSHSKRMASKLKKNGTPHKLVILKDGNHHLSLEKNRIRVLEEIEAFLATHIGS